MHPAIPDDFKNYLLNVDTTYRQKLKLIALFNADKSAALTKHQKQQFAAIFYHLRGHFIDFMWYIANFSTDKKIKEIILQNIHEEIGVGTKFSHEKLYERFAMECGVNIHHELVNQAHYLPFAMDFNKEHLRWLSEHDVDEQFATFAAYERLDNIDYIYLEQFAESLQLSPQAMTFFKVHRHVEHFGATLETLLPLWKTSPDKIKQAFTFIYSHQLAMWQQLSDTIFSE